MYRKNCDRCHRPSYSSSEYGEWHCPVCGNDLTSYPYFHAITLEKVAIFPKKKTYNKEIVAQRKGTVSNLWG